MTDARAFRGFRFPAEVILWAVRWYLRFPVSYRDLELMLADRGVTVDHTTMYRRVQRFAPELEKRVRRHLRPCRGPWHVDETYVRVGGEWRYLYRAVDGTGQTIEFMLSAKRDKKAAKRFFRKALGRQNTRNPREVVTDRLKSYPGAIREMKREGELWRFTRHRRGRWHNNRVEIGQSQMTKTDLLARPVRRHHVADLDVTIGDDHAVDQELDQGPPLLEGGSVQALPHPPAELPDGVGQASEFLPPVRLRLEAPFLFLELPLAPFEVTPAPTVLVQRHHAGEVGVRQALELLPQAHLSTP
jgi:IS6 family transposase